MVFVFLSFLIRKMKRILSPILFQVPGGSLHGLSHQQASSLACFSTRCQQIRARQMCSSTSPEGRFYISTKGLSNSLYTASLRSGPGTLQPQSRLRSGHGTHDHWSSSTSPHSFRILQIAEYELAVSWQVSGGDTDVLFMILSFDIYDTDGVLPCFLTQMNVTW